MNKKMRAQLRRRLAVLALVCLLMLSQVSLGLSAFATDDLNATLSDEQLLSGLQDTLNTSGESGDTNSTTLSDEQLLSGLQETLGEEEPAEEEPAEEQPTTPSNGGLTETNEQSVEEEPAEEESAEEEPTTPSNGGLTETNALEVEAQYADFTFTLPDSDSGATYAVNVYLQRAFDGTDYSHAWNATENYTISGTTQTSIDMKGEWVNSYSANLMWGTISDIGAGDTVTVQDIQITYPDDWGTYWYDTTNVILAVTSSDETESVVVNPATTALTEDTILPASAITIEGAVDTTTRTYGDFTFTLPTSTTTDDGAQDVPNTTTYDITVYLQRKYGTHEFTPSGFEDYAAEIANSADRAFRLTAGWVDLDGDGTDDGVYSGTLSGLSAGDTVTIADILLSQLGDDLAWGDLFDTTSLTLAVTSSNSNETVTVVGSPFTLTENGYILGAGAITSQTAAEQEPDPESLQQLTNDTLQVDGNALIFYMSNYNVVSLKDIEATHIVGPIIAQESAYRTGDTYATAESDSTTNEDYLIASDYSRGVSSYVGIMNAIDHLPYDSTFKLNYGFETKETDANGFQWETDFTPPNFYTRATEFTDNSIMVGVAQEVTDGELRDSIVLYREDGLSFYSPNNEGRVENYDTNGVKQDETTLTLQNDDYIDFDAYWQDILDASESLLEYGNFTEDDSEEMIVIDALNMTSLTLEAGKSYLIQNANMLETVDIDFPEDENGEEIYDFFDNPYPDATIINFDGTTINPTTIGGKLVSQFPETLVNGEVLDALAGDGGEYSEVGNKIIWNLPNIVTDGNSNRLVFATNGPNVAGHIIAPSAELWNYYEENGVITWGGGNLNGTAIVADFHGGVMEMHMWAYSGLEEKSTSVSLPVIKEYVNGNLDNQSFDFELDTLSSEVYVGLANTASFPYTATSDSDGNVHFPSLIFEVDSGISYPKEYKFTLQEIIPDDARDDITYDTSLYTVTVTVYKESNIVGEVEYVTLTSSYTVKKTVYNDNDTTTTDVYTASDLIFTNTKHSDSASYSFIKLSDEGHALNGAQFLLSQPQTASDPDDPDWTDATLYVSGYTLDTAQDIATISEDTGMVSFENLDVDTVYYFKEVVAPTGYALCEGYWKLEVNGYGEVFVTAMDGAPDIENHQIINYPSETETLDVTLYKATDTGKMLSGAVFTVERVLSLENPLIVEGGYHGEFTSDANGEVHITGLLYDGVYRITETKAPEGYMIPLDTIYWLLDVHADGSVDVYDPDLYEVNSDSDLIKLEGLTMINISGYVLPATGASGTKYFGLVGLLLMLGAGLCYYFYGKRRFSHET